MKQAKSITISVFALVLAFMWPTPPVWLVGATFNRPTFHMIFFPNNRFTFGNLSYVWNTIPLARYYLNTLILVVVTFCAQFVTSTLAAYMLVVMDLKGRILVFAVISMQITIPNDVLITPNFMTLADMGLTDTKVGITLSFSGSTLAIFLLRQYFKSIPKALVKAARIDGANTWQTIWRAHMPRAKPVYISLVTISVSYHWDDYLWFLIVINSPSNRTSIVGLAIFVKSKEANMQQANVCAVTFIIILPLLMAFFFLQK